MRVKWILHDVFRVQENHSFIDILVRSSRYAQYGTSIASLFESFLGVYITCLARFQDMYES